ncbi:copper-containing nitrite reductase [Noviherbaspirillum aridicola]|uniref:Copper-containing nitrite reductase n=1 Tax=Noviherbaspirillum aridicola TaxID=2849687 RepID=A0ABQ4PZR7_9BURK|nr:copper-containing nitrite reductase [Noviherbaspirillum aridicola]GIZ50388.1 hypothetical protein NCCP691_04020 [Noviherbaspirillum aridicola]
MSFATVTAGIRKPLALFISALFVAAALPAVSTAAPATKPAAQAKASVQRFVLKTGVVDGKMVYIDQQGKSNPALKAAVGDTIEIVVSSGEGAQHDIAIPELNLASAKFDGKTGPVTLRFKAEKAGKFTYICTIPGHRQIGMEGVIEITGNAAAAAQAPAPRVPTLAAAAIKAADAAAVSIAMDPNAVPKPLTDKGPQLRKYRIETVELNGKLDDGTSFTYWTFDKKVPGPMLRVRTGDTVELTLANRADSTQVHSIDLHAVTGGHGGGQHTQVAPGKEQTITFKALNPGLYVYHCATPLVPHHISAGMYGLILVEPEGGLPKVDREFYVMQGDIYTSHKHGTKGHQDFDVDKMAAELPDYYVFNGAVGALTKEHKMEARTGETVRIYFGVGGPNKISSFHVIGEIFDKVYSEGSISTVKKDVQTTLVPAGGATIVDFKVEYPGSYLLVDHALSRAGKGLVGKIDVTGPADSSVYKVGKAAD